MSNPEFKQWAFEGKVYNMVPDPQGVCRGEGMQDCAFSNGNGNQTPCYCKDRPTCSNPNIRFIETLPSPEPVTMSDSEYLHATSIVKLQSAARMAGLRFKSGTPGFDKAGIIAKLEQSPSIMRAAIAVLKRLDGGGNPFADEIEEETHSPAIPTPVPTAIELPKGEGSDALQATLERILRNIGGMAAKLNCIEDGANKTDVRGLQREIDNCRNAVDTYAADIIALQRDIEKLKERTPTDIHIKELPVIKLDGSEHKSYKKLLTYLHINRRVILTGSAGTGKSMAAHNAAKHFNVAFHLQTPVTMDHQFLGHRDAQGVFHETPTFKAYTQGGLLLWDEADAGLPDAMLSANPIFDGNGFAMFGDGNMYKQHPDFMAIFNMNTDGNGATMQYAGRNRLDGATLARFGVRIHWDIDADIERSMALGNAKWYGAILAVRQFLSQRQIVDVNATPRHTKTGAALLAAGCTPPDVLTDVLRSGALSEAWNDVLRLPAVSDFLRG
jgi:MoxR-like ATPase